MTDHTANIGISKRQALQKMFGIGAGLAAADLLLPGVGRAAGVGLPAKGAMSRSPNGGVGGGGFNRRSHGVGRGRQGG